jgi:hypothetical protein
LDGIRQRIWNQNLATVIVEVFGDRARVVPARKLKDSNQEIQLTEAQPDGPFSALDIASANLSRRFPSWFDVDARVDRKLLDNLSSVVKALCQSGFKGGPNEKVDRRRAELLMGQVLFISYLEHRQIVGSTYRERRNVNQLHGLISSESRDCRSKKRFEVTAVCGHLFAIELGQIFPNDARLEDALRTQWGTSNGC